MGKVDVSSLAFLWINHGTQYLICKLYFLTLYMANVYQNNLKYNFQAILSSQIT